MKILVICNYSELYGANRSMLTILESLKKKRHQLLIILPFKGPIEQELAKLDIDFKVVRFFPSYLYLKLMYKHLLVPILFFYNFLVLPKLLQLTKQFNPDLIYSNTSAENVGIILSKILRIKHISHIREFMSLDHGAFFVLGRGIKRKFIDMSDGVIFVSKAVANYVLIEPMPITGKHEVIYDGIDSNKPSLNFKPIPEIIKFGSVGVLQESKGHHLAVDYFSQYIKMNPNAELHIYGKGYALYEKLLRKKIADYGLENKVIMHGFLKNTSEIYAGIDVLCVFSRSEGFGRVTLEAMLEGVPVIGLNKGGTPELIKHRSTGFLIENYEAFKSSVDNLFTSNSIYNQIRTDAAEDAKRKFSVKNYVNSVEAFMLKIANK